MKVLSLIAVGVLSLVASLGQVDGFCHSVLSIYYDCKAQYSNKPAQTQYFFNSFLPDSFYSGLLSNITTFPQAMNMFRALFAEIRSCRDAWCPCARYFLHDATFPNYTYFFNNTQLFTQTVATLNAVKTKYTLLSTDEIAAQTDGFINFDEFYEGYDFLNGFCAKYDFSWEMFLFYEETMPYEVAVMNNHHDCMSSYVSLNTYVPLQNFTRGPLEDYMTCLLTAVALCPIEIERGIALTELYYFPFVIQGTNLTSYIDRLIGVNKPVLMTRYYSHIYYGFEVYSYNKGFQYCDFDPNVKYNVFNSTNLRIEGTGSLGMEGVDILGSITLTFTYDKSTTRTFTASVGSLPTAFDTKGTVVINDPRGRKWLELSSYVDLHNMGDTYTSVVITDSFTNSTILIEDCRETCVLELSTPMSMYTTGGRNTLLVDGCRKRVASNTVDNYFKSL